MNETDSRRVLGAFLRAHRERMAPPARAATRRRTPGLRREELADICGVSATWITWLEQGRDISASATALARLAEALHLAPAERAYLFDVAGKHDRAAPLDNEGDLPPDLLNLPSVVTVPAYLLDRTWTARAWNSCRRSPVRRLARSRRGAEFAAFHISLVSRTEFDRRLGGASPPSCGRVPRRLQSTAA